MAIEYEDKMCNVLSLVKYWNKPYTIMEYKSDELLW